jgi:hypothetical protein
MHQHIAVLTFEKSETTSMAESMATEQLEARKVGTTIAIRALLNTKSTASFATVRQRLAAARLGPGKQ